MGLSIKDEETERLVRQLARRERISLTRAIRLAVTNEICRNARRTPEEIEEIDRRLGDLQAAVQKDGFDHSLSDDAILGYDEFGLPN